MSRLKAYGPTHCKRMRDGANKYWLGRKTALGFWNFKKFDGELLARYVVPFDKGVQYSLDQVIRKTKIEGGARWG